MNKNYGYHVNLNKNDKEELEHLIEFTTSTDLLFYSKNLDYILKELRILDWDLVEENEYESEKELIFLKGIKKIFLYV